MIAGRVWRALRTRPKARDLAELSLALAAFAAIGGGVALTTGLAHPAPRATDDLAILAVQTLFIPVLGEEIVFRAALTPGRGESKRPALWIFASTLAFGLWHVLETKFLPGAAAIFLRTDFLALALLLGALCALLRYRSRSIWTAVALHWGVVVVWQAWLGGPSLAALTQS